MGVPVFDRVRQIVADVFQLEPQSVIAESSPATVEKWDSINHLNLMLALESEFGVAFAPEEIDHLDSVAVIVRALEGKLGLAAPQEAASPSVPAPAPQPAASPEAAAIPQAASTSALEIRQLEPGDLPVVTALLSRRDGRNYDPESLGRFLCGLDPRHFTGWLAFAQGQPVGMTAVYLRDVFWGGEVLHAGYWADLYVREEFRKHLVYQRLVHAMMKESSSAGLDVIYTVIRRPGVAEAHMAMGFQSLGFLDVRVKPLRPFSMLGRYRGWKALEGVSPPLDALYQFGLASSRPRLPSRIQIVATDSSSPHLQGLLDMLARQAGARVHQLWTAKSWRLRFAATLEGGAYRLLLALDGQKLLGGLLMRSAEREGPGGAPISLAVVMDLSAPEGDSSVAEHLLVAAERRALQEGCHALLWLDGVAELAPLMSSRGFRSSPETYRLIVWPQTRVAPGSPAEKLSNWRFPFSEHDAF